MTPLPERSFEDLIAADRGKDRAPSGVETSMTPRLDLKLRRQMGLPVSRFTLGSPAQQLQRAVAVPPPMGYPGQKCFASGSCSAAMMRASSTGTV
jgi:hypothetical protein